MEIDIDMGGIEVIIGKGVCEHYIAIKVQKDYTCNDCDLTIPEEEMASKYTPHNGEGSTLYFKETHRKL